MIKVSPPSSRFDNLEKQIYSSILLKFPCADGVGLHFLAFVLLTCFNVKKKLKGISVCHTNDISLTYFALTHLLQNTDELLS